MKRLLTGVKINPLFILMGFSIILASCGKSGVKPSVSSDTTKTTGTVTVSSGVYIGGYETATNDIGQTFQVAKIWKDGKATSLTDGKHDACVQSVFVTGTDIYAAGYIYQADDQTPIATVWKNGKATALATTQSQANGIFVSGTDVYICGYVQAGSKISAVIWKNGVTNALPAYKPSVYYPLANSIYVSGGITYVAGIDSTATIWKNGVSEHLAGGTYNTIRGIYEANSLFFSGSDVFAAGSVNASIYNSVAVIWKNGVPTALTSKTNSDGIAYGVYVNGTSIYAVGREQGTNGDANYIAKYWKNGTGSQADIYTSTKLSSYESQANAIAGSGTDTYILWDDSKAFNPGAKFTIKLWKNGVSTAITDGVNSAHGASIFIKQ